MPRLFLNFVIVLLVPKWRCYHNSKVEKAGSDKKAITSKSILKPPQSWYDIIRNIFIALCLWFLIKSSKTLIIA